MFFRILESKESRIAAPTTVILLVIGLVVHHFVNNVEVVQFVVPLLGLALGCLMGWVIGESFVYASGIGKVFMGGLSFLFSTAFTFDALRQRMESSREKVFYLVSLIPIINPAIINAMISFSLAFLLLFFISLGVNFTRRMEKENKG
jgi:hypothetical protein